MALSTTDIHRRWLAKLKGIVSWLRGDAGFGTGPAMASKREDPLVSAAKDHSARSYPPSGSSGDRIAEGQIALIGLSTLNLDLLLDRLLKQVVGVSEADYGSIMLLDETFGVLRPGACHGVGNQANHDAVIEVGRGLVGRIAETRRPATTADASREPASGDFPLCHTTAGSMLGIPIMAEDRLLGVMHVGRRTVRPFSLVDVERMEGIGAQVALAISRALLHRELAAANADLLTANRRLQTVIDTIPAAVAIFEATNGCVISANRAAEELWGHRPVPEAGFAELQAAYGLHHPNGEPVSWYDLPMIRSIDRGENVLGEELLVRQEGGKELLVLVSSAPLRDTDGRIEGAVAIFQDTSGMKLEQLKDEFVAVTAHELFTPLTTIKGAAQLLERKLEARADGEVLEALKAIDARTDLMSYLLKKLIDAAELQTGPLELCTRTTDLAGLAAKVVRRFQSMTNRHEIVLFTDDKPVIGQWDKNRVERVLANLVENAIKYSPDGGRVEVEVKPTRLRNPLETTAAGAGDRPYAMVRVSDQGIGIPKREQSHLFRRFYRAGPANYQESSGLGLGLYIANRIVTAHGGHICVESEPGAGSSFYFTLPMEDGPAREGATQAPRR